MGFDTSFYELENMTIVDALAKADTVLKRHKKIAVSISGGSDSDIVIDMVEKLKTPENEVKYVWFDTGFEYQATKDHLEYLEEKYGVKIERRKAIKPIPTCVREYGVPFLSKFVSDRISTLQKIGFEFQDEPYDVLIEKYPKNKSAIKWWCNKLPDDGSPGAKMYMISYNKWLKEFLVENPPKFKIANKCCYYAKKKVAKAFYSDSDADLSVIGVRRAEGGIRATSYKSCYTEGGCIVDSFRPIFWMTDEDKRFYEQEFGIKHSACYSKYGLKRTGCVGCPYGKNINNELGAIEKYEPKLYKACMKVFGQSYEYTKQYRQFCAERNYDAKQNPDQLSMFDMYFDFAMV